MSVNGGLTTAANLISVYSATSLQMIWVSSVICIAISGKFSAKISGVWPNLRQLNFDAPELTIAVHTTPAMRILKHIKPWLNYANKCSSMTLNSDTFSFAT